MEASSSAINAPHPDGGPDEAELFFGGEDAAADPDPGDFNPESGTFDAPSEEEMEAEAAATADEPRDDAPPLLTPEQQETEAKAYADRHAAEIADGVKVDPGQEQQAKLRAIAEKEAAEAGAAVATGDAAVAAPKPEKQSGSLEREYIVFQQVVLNEKVLKHLLAQLESGSEPKVAHVELHRATARNDKLAIGEAYSKHASALGTKCKLAAVSSRSFKTREIKPREVPQAAISIT